ncbi:MAG: radical SAM family heme chaperone HemW [Candidatus Eisenbacteria bacterium]
MPFCAVRCGYCHFSTGPLSAAALDRWFRALELECALRASTAASAAFSSVFFGGGTPSQLSARHFARLTSLLRAHFSLTPDAEVTLEANPESVRPALLDAWRSGGVNRLSMGAQSFEPEELRQLDRIHGAARPGEALALARVHGFERLSLDLMFAYPGHRLEAFERSLEHALSLGPEHLSAYAYIPEQGTPMGDAVHRGEQQVADDETQAAMYSHLTERAGRQRWIHYETSNFCTPGAEARHNLTYWLRRDYLGLGPSAHGAWRGERYGNAYALSDWASRLERGESPEVEHERETDASVAEEIVMLGLRLGSGIRIADYPCDIWTLVDARFGPAFEQARIQGRLERTAHGWQVPAESHFVADDIIAWLASRAQAPQFDSVSPPSLISSPCPSPLSPAA